MNTEDPTADPAVAPRSSDPTPVERYEIRVMGRLGSRWASWFDGLTLTHADDGTTVISGPIVDQAALHGLLQRLRDLGVTLLSLTCTAAGEAFEHPISPNHPNDPNQPNPVRQ